MSDDFVVRWMGRRVQVFLQNVGITALLLPIPIVMAEFINWYWSV